MPIASAPLIWIIVGLIGQGFFAARFIVQWLHSEAVGKSRFPRLFWYISVVAGAILLCYAIHRRDPVFIAGEAVTLAIFCRNLHWLLRRPADAAAHADDVAP
jgi:lipid-A-disaccharide synthase-like uncharacterized protein